MTRILLVLLAALAALGADAPAPLIDSLDEPRFREPKEKGRAELVEGKSGKAVRFSFDADSRSVFFTSGIRGRPEWDTAEGFSFWVKGDGSQNFGGLEFIYDEDYSVRYDAAFPLHGTEWTRVTLAWRDLVPVLPGPKAKPLDPRTGNPPSKLSALWIGKWWYWREYPALTFTMDDLRLEPSVPRAEPEAPPGPPLARARAKLKAGKPVTLVTMGDSLTDFQHWSNRPTSWPRLLQARLQEKYGSQVTLENPAIGGTQLRQNLVLMPRWLARTPEPDLVTVLFGFNDWDAGMRGPEFEEACRDAVDRIRRATSGKADVLLLTTLPSVARWRTMAELGEAVRRAARDRKAGLADTEQAFLAEGKEMPERLYGFDKTHLSPAGHEVIARTVLAAIEGGTLTPR